MRVGPWCPRIDGRRGYPRAEEVHVIGPSGNVRVMVATKPVDFREGAEGLAALVRETIRAVRSRVIVARRSG
jgi:hypothetical protein